jgi:predicted nucleotidyltransferase
MPDVFAVANLFVSKVVDCHVDEADLVAYYGSYSQGTAGPGSDLDIFYIPAEGKSPPVGRTVLIAGVLLDFWPIRWDTMEGFATGQLRGWSLAPAIVHHAKVIHKRSDEAEMRLGTLKQKVLDLQKPAARSHMIKRSLGAFKDVLAHLENLRLAAVDGRLDDLRHAGFQVALSAWECLALANQAFFDPSRHRRRRQFRPLPEVPPPCDQDEPFE